MNKYKLLPVSKLDLVLKTQKLLIILLLSIICFPIFTTESSFAQTAKEAEQYKSSTRRVVQKVRAILPMQDVETEFDIEVVDGLAIYEGDIVLGPAAQFDPNVEYAVAISGNSYRWANGIIPYVIAGGHPKKAQIEQAIQHLNQKTKLCVTPRTTQADYVEFISGSGCWSYVGRQGGKQQISIGNFKIRSIP